MENTLFTFIVTSSISVSKLVASFYTSLEVIIITLE